MAKQRFINTKFWEDSYISDLDPSEKLVFLYLLTNSATSICGIYEIPAKRIAADTGYDKEMIIKILGRFERDKKIIYREGWVIIVNFLKHQNTTSPQVKKGIDNELLSVPAHIQQYLYGIDTTPHSHLDSNLDLDLNLSSDVPAVAETKDDDAVACTQYLYDNIKERTNPPVWEKKPPKLDAWYKDIEALHRIDGITYENIRRVIAWCTKDSFWKNNILSGATLRKQFNQLYIKMNAPARSMKSGYDPNDQEQKDALDRILKGASI